IAQLGSLAVQLPLLFVLIIFLTIRSRFTTAINLLGASSAAFILSLLLKLTVTVQAPDVIFGDIGSYPSLEVMLATVCYGFIATMLAGELQSTKRKWVYIVFFTIIIAAALSRLYLGMHWPSDIIAAWTFGGVWLGVISIAYRRHPHPTLNTPLLSLVIFVTISSSYLFQYYSGSYETKFAKLKPQTSIKMIQKDSWLLYPESVIPKQGPGHERMINVQFAASLNELEKRLTSEGWKRATPVSWQSLLLTLSPEPEIERLPVLKITLRDQLPVGQWLKETNQGLVLLHIWPSNITISQTRRIWLGQKQKVHLSQQLYFLHALVAQKLSELTPECKHPSAWNCEIKNNIELLY
ncbi:MAG: phosphatase PAP2 family protein, partial [bacterium]